jgi:hypothetical protein
MRQIQSSAISGDRKQGLNQTFNHNLVTLGNLLAVEMAKSLPAGIA